MVAYTVSKAKREKLPVKTTLYLEGEVTTKEWEKLRELCLDALKSSDELVLNINKVTKYDYSFTVLVCLLRRTVQLLSKRLHVIGKNKDSFICIYDVALRSKTERCSFTEANPYCMWENLFTNSALASVESKAGLKLKKNNGNESVTY